MEKVWEFLLIVVYMLANGFLHVFKMYNDTNDGDLAKAYDNKLIRRLSKLSGYVIIILLFPILVIFGIKMTIMIFGIGFLGQKFFNIIVHYLIVLPINNTIYKNKK